MSLSDRYNRGDGRIQQFDRYMTELGNVVGNWWSDLTGWSRRSLTQGLYIASALAAAQHGVIFQDPFVYMIGAVSVLSFIGLAGQSRGGVVEQLQAEAAGLPKNSLAALRLLMLFLGILSLADVAVGVVASAFDPSQLSGFMIDSLLIGIAFTTLQASDYICRTNPTTGKGGRGKLVHAPLS